MSPVKRLASILSRRSSAMSIKSPRRMQPPSLVGTGERLSLSRKPIDCASATFPVSTHSFGTSSTISTALLHWPGITVKFVEVQAFDCGAFGPVYPLHVRGENETREMARGEGENKGDRDRGKERGRRRESYSGEPMQRPCHRHCHDHVVLTAVCGKHPVTLYHGINAL